MRLTSACKVCIAWPIVFGALIFTPCAAHAQASWRTIVLQPPAGGYISEGEAAYGSMQGGTVSPIQFGGTHPVLWNGTSKISVDLHPGGDWFSAALTGIWAGRQVGYTTGSGLQHAAVWNGTAHSYTDIDLNSTAYRGSIAAAIRGSQIVGYAGFSATGLPHAVLWNDVSNNAVDLNKPGAMDWSRGKATDGEYQGGSAHMITGGIHAALWHGTASSFVDLNPAGSFESLVFGMAPGVQVGEAKFPGGHTVAAVWRGTSSSFMSLNPSGALYSSLTATSGSLHVGAADFGAGGRAGIWMSDNPASFVDLGSMVGSNLVGSSANAIYTDSEHIYVVGQARLAGQDLRAILWVYDIPSPSAAGVFGAASVLARRRWRQ